jgi:hypothetical protein
VVEVVLLLFWKVVPALLVVEVVLLLLWKVVPALSRNYLLTQA